MARFLHDRMLLGWMLLCLAAAAPLLQPPAPADRPAAPATAADSDEGLAATAAAPSADSGDSDVPLAPAVSGLNTPPSYRAQAAAAISPSPRADPGCCPFQARAPPAG